MEDVHLQVGMMPEALHQQMGDGSDAAGDAGRVGRVETDQRKAQWAAHAASARICR